MQDIMHRSNAITLLFNNDHPIQCFEITELTDLTDFQLAANRSLKYTLWDSVKTMTEHLSPSLQTSKQ